MMGGIICIGYLTVLRVFDALEMIKNADKNFGRKTLRKETTWETWPYT
jgi:hypothetical protein